MADIAQVIQYEGDNTTFIWRHPVENFNTGTQLIVHESQEALFFMNGQALDLFGPGRYTLETQNLPLVGKFLNRATSDRTPFHCEVYFINKTEQMAIKWGTDSKVEYVEPTYQFPIKIGASGEMSLRAQDARQLMVKLVGTERFLDQAGLTQKFRMFLMPRIKTYLAQLIKTEKIDIFQIDEYLTAMSESLHERLAPDFAEYGLALEQFFVSTIVKPEEDRLYQKFKELHFRQYADVAEAQLRQRVGIIEQQTQKERMVIQAQGMAQKRELEGYTYQQERGYDVAEKVAQNEAVGEFSNMGIGLGMVTGVGGTVGNTVGGILQNTLQAPLQEAAPAPEAVKCAKCGQTLPAGAKFCVSCGQRLAAEQLTLITCPACGERTPMGKFCIACGAALTPKCPKCGVEVPTGGKFCPECGEKL